jgi:hypothetical protein
MSERKLSCDLAVSHLDVLRYTEENENELRGATLGQTLVEGFKVKYTCIEGLKNSPQCAINSTRVSPL